MALGGLLRRRLPQTDSLSLLNAGPNIHHIPGGVTQSSLNGLSAAFGDHLRPHALWRSVLEGTVAPRAAAEAL